MDGFLQSCNVVRVPVITKFNFCQVFRARIKIERRTYGIRERYSNISSQKAKSKQKITIILNYFRFSIFSRQNMAKRPIQAQIINTLYIQSVKQLNKVSSFQFDERKVAQPFQNPTQLWIIQIQYQRNSMNSQHLIDEIEQIQKEPLIKSSKNNIREFFLDGKMNFTIKQNTNTILVTLQFIFIGLSAAHFIIAQSLLSHQQDNYLNAIIDFLQKEPSFYRIIQIFMIVLKALLVLSVYMQIKDNQYVAGISWLNQQIFKSFRILKEVDLVLSAYLCIINLEENVGFLVISTFIYMFHAVYLQNYVIRKETTYATSFHHYLAFRFFILLNYTANIILLALNNLPGFVYLYAFFAIFVFIWYAMAGRNLFYHQMVRKMHLLVISLLLTVYLNCFISFGFNSQDFVQISNISRMILLFLAAAFLLNFFNNKFEHRSINNTKSSAKSIDLSLQKLLEQSLRSADHDAQLIGILNLVDISSMNEQTQTSFYDPILRCMIKHQERYIQKQSTLKRYIKSVYEDRIESQNGENRSIYIDVCQFLCNYNSNYFEIYKYLTIAKSFPLDILQRIKIDRIQSIVKQCNSKLNGLLYEGQLQLEEIIDSENIFAKIEAKIKHYINRYIRLWSMLKEQEISLLLFRLLLKKQFKLIQDINNRWKKIVKFFDINKKWHFIYIHYLFFVKNQKIKQKETDIFRSMKIGNQSVFDTKPIYFRPNAKEEDLCNPLIVFNEDSCCLQAEYFMGSLIIRDVNRRFQTIFGFKKDEIVNNPIDLLMDRDLRKVHPQKFNSWIQDGYISNENSYHVKDTFIITKQLIKMPAFKYFKTYFTLSNTLCFYCMIKINLRTGLMDGPGVNSSQLIMTSTALDNPTLVTDAKVKNHFPSASLNEHVEKNIFLKQQLLQPVNNFPEIKYFKWYSRLFMFIICFTIITLLIITESNGTKLTKYSNQFINYMGMYRFPVILTTNYMKYFLGVGNATKVNAQIQSSSNNFLNNFNIELTQITIFDKFLNPPNTYAPYYNYSFLNDQRYNQVDLFYMIGSTISSLYKAPVNQTSREFQRLNSYLKPSYDKMMNTTKFALHHQFGNIFDSCINNQLLFIVLQGGIFFIFLVVLFTCVHKFIVKMRDILHILLDFNEEQLYAIHNYWKYQQEHFNILFMQFNQEQGSLKLLTSENMIKKLSNIRTSDDKISLNKKSKQINEDRERKCFEYRLRMMIVGVMVAILAITVSVEIIMITKLTYLKTFQQAGFFFLKYFPTGPLTTMGCTQKYYADRFPDELSFNPDKYQDVLSSMYIFGNNNNYIGQVLDPTSTYFIKQKNYFFGSPCEFNPAILNSAGINVTKCITMSNGTFRDGLSSFLRYGQRLGYNCIYNKVNLTAPQLDEFTLGGNVLSAYVLDAITTWVSEFSQKVVDLEKMNRIQSLIVVFSILAIHLLINELKILRIVEEQYDFIKKVYLNLVPESTLINEKVIKQKFIIAGLIRS